MQEMPYIKTTEFGENISISEVEDCIRALSYFETITVREFLVIFNAFVLKKPWNIQEFSEKNEAGRDCEQSANLMDGCFFDISDRNNADAIRRFSEMLESSDINRKDFSEASEDELNEMFREIMKLVRKISVKPGRRLKKSKKGKVDLRATISASVKSGGIPLKLHRRGKKPGKADLWILCDMSNSVRAASEFMIMLTFLAQKRFNSVHSFIFVDTLLEVSDFFNARDWNEARNGIFGLKGHDGSGFSHYGKVFHQFEREYIEQLNRYSTVIILGDAKNNWNKFNGAEVLKRIRDKARSLCWLCTLPEQDWDKDDCLINIYKKNCSSCYECRNISQLSNFITQVQI